MKKGSKMTPEARAKISESQKRRWLIRSIGYTEDENDKFLIINDKVLLPVEKKEHWWEGWFRRR